VVATTRSCRSSTSCTLASDSDFARPFRGCVRWSVVVGNSAREATRGPNTCHNSGATSIALHHLESSMLCRAVTLKSIWYTDLLCAISIRTCRIWVETRYTGGPFRQVEGGKYRCAYAHTDLVCSLRPAVCAGVQTGAGTASRFRKWMRRRCRRRRGAAQHQRHVTHQRIKWTIMQLNAGPGVDKLVKKSGKCARDVCVCVCVCVMVLLLYFIF